MTRTELLLAYKQGRVSKTELLDKLRERRPGAAADTALSVGQQGLWMLQKAAPRTNTYNVPMCLRLQDSVDVVALEQAFRFLIEQHPLLGCVVAEEDGAPRLRAARAQGAIVQLEDISHLPAEQVIPCLNAKAKQPFSLAEGPLMRVHLMSRSEREQYLLIVVHHLVFDGASVPLLRQTLLEAYEGFSRGAAPVAASAATSYGDFVEWERRFLESEAADKHREYWTQQLAGARSTLPLPTDRQRTWPHTPEGDTVSGLIAPELASRVASFALSARVSQAAVFLAAYNLLLYRHSGETDVIVGMPTVGRPEDEFASVIGYFVNMVALRSRLQGSQRFDELLKAVQLTLVDALDHAVYPFPRVVRDLGLLRDRGTSFFQAAFAYQHASLIERANGGTPSATVETILQVRQEGEFELALEVWERAAGFEIDLKFDTGLFERQTVGRLLERYISLLEQVVEHPERTLDEYGLITAQERAMVVRDWNATDEVLSRGLGVHELFEQQAKRTPEAIALTFEGLSITYAELDRRSTALAAKLREKGVRADRVVGVMMERSLELIVGLMGILKAGGAYLPLDPQNPDARLEFMLGDAQCPALILQERFLGRAAQFSGARIVLDNAADGPDSSVAESGSHAGQPSDLAYVIYTSGSTGVPKGCMVEHAAICNCLLWLQRQYPLTADDVVLQKTPYTFDISVLEFFWPLLAGARLVIARPEGHRDASYIARLIRAEQVTVCQFVPSVLNAFLGDPGAAKCESLRNVFTIGEPLPPELVRQFKRMLGSRLHNVYGPTETAVEVTYWECEERADGKVPIGRPIPNVQMHILDSRLEPVAVGIEGDLYIAGACLGRGYLNRPELTAERFIRNPFGPAGSRMYRTGDRARYLPDGNIEFLGREDDQVKVRGHRVEPGEIESALRALPSVRQAAVIAKKDDNGQTRLVAYVVPQVNHQPAPAELRRALLASLPEVMVPSTFELMLELPLTVSGKLDRKALSAMGRAVPAPARVAALPTSQLEEQVTAIWREMLKIDRVGVEEGFFEAGGDSILAVRVAQRIRERMKVEFDVTALFRCGTIRNISQYVAEQQRDAGDSQQVAERQGQPEARDARAVEPSKQSDSAASTEWPEYYAQSVAIVGMSCRFPGADDYREFWSNLTSGVESIRVLDAQQLREQGVPESLVKNPRFVGAQATIEGKELFDPEFFNISARDAQLMDPQLRQLLMHAWRAVEDAGYVPSDVEDAGVYMSASNSFYAAVQGTEGTSGSLQGVDQYLSWVLSQSGTIPTVISHKLGLKGPSVFVHSNCSSSIVAMDAAFRVLNSGQTRHALVGAATLFARQMRGYVHQEGLNFSSDGHVKAFDASADGMVAGEGVAVIVLKRALDALADGDHIYALLRSVAVNNDGGQKVGFYAPSVTGQKRVIEQALREAHVSAQSIGYVEAHGTGTRLGDPIELAALSEAYAQPTGREGCCGIGSVKSNVGHLDTVAGLAGCIKAALSLKHGQIPPTLNYRQPNPGATLQGTPFYVVDRLKAWPTDQVRRAGLSSFGIGGTNTHAVLEQAPEKAITQSEQPAPAGGYVVPLSARTPERLRVYAQSLLQFLKNAPSPSLADLAYTLQVGREPMDCRLAFIVNSLQELTARLERFVGDDASGDWYRGNAEIADGIGRVLEAEDLREMVRSWLQNGRLDKLARVWVGGAAVDWKALHRQARPRRASLPTYPFAQDPYVLSRGTDRPADARHAGPDSAAPLHPLVQQNTSDLQEQKFTSTFSGEEFFLRDHVVHGVRMLPGVAYLELARAAVALASGSTTARTRLRSVVWSHPLVVGESPVTVSIGLYPRETGEIDFEIYTPTSDEQEPVVYSQGYAVITEEPAAPFTHDLAELRARCSQYSHSGERVSADARTVGFELGAAFRALERADVGTDSQGRLEVLATIALPEAVRDTSEKFLLHPSMLDAAIVAASIVTTGPENHGKASVPFALEQVEPFQPCPQRVHAYIRSSAGDSSETRTARVDIDLCDDDGRVCVRLKGFSRRNLEAAPAAVASTAALLFEPEWRARNVAADAPARKYVHHWVLECAHGHDDARGVEERTRARLQADPDLRHSSYAILDSGGAELADAYERHAAKLFETVQSILRGHPNGDVLVQVVVSAGEHPEAAVFEGLAGLLRSAALEDPRFHGQLIQVRASEWERRAEDILKENLRAPQEQVIRYRDGERQTLHWTEVNATVQASDALSTCQWKDGGVYLITGGAGGLGKLVAQDIANRVKSAVLILVGRSAADQHAGALEELRSTGSHVDYRSVDVCDERAVDSLVDAVCAEHGRIHGVVHAAGILRDSFMVRKTAEEMHAVLAPKVRGLCNLDRATRHLNLDLFVTFSSMSGTLGNAGQADYAAANAFMDAYAGFRVGRMLAIDWPLWEQGGMQVDEKIRQGMWRSIGVAPLQTAGGLAALHQAMASDRNQVMVLSGDPARIRQRIGAVNTPVAAPVRRELAAAGAPVHEAKLEAAMIREVVSLLKIRQEGFDVHSELSTYGFDSLTFTQLTNHLNQVYQLDLAPTIFFEHPTLHGFVRYLLKDHSGAVSRYFAQAEGASAAASQTTHDTQQPQAPAPRRGRRRAGSRFVQNVDAAPARGDGIDQEPVAIIGISGRFPHAEDLDAFWNNLVEARDCVTEIPAERWDWREIYGDPAREPNKTNIKWGAFMDGVAEFDPLFFGISPREAQFMDPNQRLILLHAWKAIEDAGYSPQSLSGSKTAVFVGMTSSPSYAQQAARAPIEGHTIIGMVPSLGPGRLSYLLNLHGPSEAIETACSSSLVAIHRALMAMRIDGCDTALVGGVNTILTSSGHIGFSKAGMLSNDGSCKTFSAKANGYVRGEGVGILLLKRLSAAERDGDHIYALIRGSAENHGGRASSLTAPNPQAQADVLKQAYRRAGIDPRSVGYIEAHGTGTPLGDPVEINGLKSAFQELYQENGHDMAQAQAHCGLGSVKTNIGHLELAAGAAGILKVVLQLKHRTLVKSRNFEELNPYIKLADSPFRIVRENETWAALRDANGHEMPRRAGVSSFGFGGVNAHVVVEEYVAAESAAARHPTENTQPALIPLSARTAERLTVQMQQLHDALTTGDFSDADLHGIAYTLQIGRDAMEHRIGLLAGSLQELKEKLARILAGQAVDGCYRGEVQRAQAAQSTHDVAQDGRELVARHVEHGHMPAVLELWVRGQPVDWKLVHGQAPHRRVSLPTYPFAKERYWAPDMPTVRDAGRTPVQRGLHAVVHQNTSSFAEQRFSSTFTGSDGFVRDHVVLGKPILPAVVYLEMARAAVVLSKGEDDRQVKLRNSTWLRPLVVEEAGTAVEIALYPQDDGEIDYEVFTSDAAARNTRVVHAQGTAFLARPESRPTHDLAALRARCQGQETAGDWCYAALEKAGFDYGPSHRALRSLCVGSDERGRRFVLARLEVRDEAAATFDRYTLHPGLLDSAIQSSLGLVFGGSDKAVPATGPGQAALPYVLDEIECFSACPARSIAVVREVTSGSSHFRKVDIDVCDEAGNVCVRMSGFTTRVLTAESSAHSRDEEALYDSIVASIADQHLSAADFERLFTAGGSQAIEDATVRGDMDEVVH